MFAKNFCIHHVVISFADRYYINFSFSYYSVQFDLAKVAVSIRQSKPLLRDSRMWGTARLAVEGMDCLMLMCLHLYIEVLPYFYK